MVFESKDDGVPEVDIKVRQDYRQVFRICKKKY